MKFYHAYLILCFIVFFSCSSDKEEPITDAFDGEYQGVSTIDEEIGGVWDIVVSDGEIKGTTRYIEGNTVFSADFEGVVRSSGTFSFNIDFGGGFSSTIDGLIFASGTISGSWRDSEGLNGEIMGQPLTDDYEKFNGKYGGIATNSDYEWDFEIRDGILEGKFHTATFADYIGLKGNTLKLTEFRFGFTAQTIKVIFAIFEDGTVDGAWVDVSDDFVGGEISGGETSKSTGS